MSVGETHAFGGDTIHRGGRDLGVGIVGSNVAIAQIVCEYNNNIGPKLPGFPPFNVPEMDSKYPCFVGDG